LRFSSSPKRLSNSVVFRWRGIKTSEQIQGFAHAHLVGQGGGLQGRADYVFELRAAALRIKAANTHAAAIRRTQPFENFDRAGLPAPFGPSRPKTSPSLTEKLTPAQGFHVTVALGQVLDFDDSCIHEPLSIAYSVRAGESHPCLFVIYFLFRLTRAFLPGGLPLPSWKILDASFH